MKSIALLLMLSSTAVAAEQLGLERADFLSGMASIVRSYGFQCPVAMSEKKVGFSEYIGPIFHVRCVNKDTGAVDEYKVTIGSTPRASGLFLVERWKDR